jgi:hypothetical protein
VAFALQLRKKHGKTSVRVAEECQLAKNIQNRFYFNCYTSYSLRYLIKDITVFVIITYDIFCHI